MPLQNMSNGNVSWVQSLVGITNKWHILYLFCAALWQKAWSATPEAPSCSDCPQSSAVKLPSFCVVLLSDFQHHLLHVNHYLHTCIIRSVLSDCILLSYSDNVSANTALYKSVLLLSECHSVIILSCICVLLLWECHSVIILSCICVLLLS